MLTIYFIMAKSVSDGKKGGLLGGKRHVEGGVKAIIVDDSNRPVELESGEAIIKREAVQKHWELLSKINQEAGGNPIHSPKVLDDDPTEEFKEGGKIVYDSTRMPRHRVMVLGKKLRSDYPEIWKQAGNIYGNQAFKNLQAIEDRGYWLPKEKWFFIKWRSYVARHKQDNRLHGVIAMIKWGDVLDMGYDKMKVIIDKEIDKIKNKKK